MISRLARWQPMGLARHICGFGREGGACNQLHRTSGKSPDAQFRALQIGKNADGATEFFFQPADRLNPLVQHLVAGMAHVDAEDIDAGLTLCQAPLPQWVFKGPVDEVGGVHTAEGSWSPAQGRFVAPLQLPVHARQHFPEAPMGSPARAAAKAGTTVHEDDAIRLWTLDQQVLIASIKTKMHAISPDVAEGLLRGVDVAEATY